jgi:hypothetical protein
MGLFNYIFCFFPLPLKGANKLEYQTKDLEPNFMETYEIRENGTLWKKVYDIEDHRDPKTKGWKRVRVNLRWKRQYPTTTIWFYTYIGDINDEKKKVRWIEWRAELVKGKVTEIKRVKNRK